MFTTIRSSVLPILLFGFGTLHAQSDARVSAEDGLLTIQASDVTASSLAQQLSQELGISVIVTGDSEMLVNLDIVDEPLVKVLGKLSPNYVLVRSSDGSKITEVILMMGGAGGSDQFSPEGSDSQQGSEEFLPSGSPADEIAGDQLTDQAQQESDLQIEIDNQAMINANEAAAAATAAEAEANSNAKFWSEQNTPTYNEAGQLLDPATGLPYKQ